MACTHFRQLVQEEGGKSPTVRADTDTDRMPDTLQFFSAVEMGDRGESMFMTMFIIHHCSFPGFND
jgi:hypothetical protein